MSSTSPAERRRPGRRARLDEPHRMPDGLGGWQDRTIADAIVWYLEQGVVGVDRVAQLVNVSTRRVYDWLQIGTRAEDRWRAGARYRDLTAEERRCRKFTLRARQAIAVAEARNVAVLTGLALGGYQTVDVVETHQAVLHPDGSETDLRVIDRKVTTRTHAPDRAAAMWLLARRDPDRWGGGGRIDPDAGFGDLLDPPPPAALAATTNPVDDLDDLMRDIASRNAAAEAVLADDPIEVDEVDDTP